MLPAMALLDEFSLPGMMLSLEYLGCLELVMLMLFGSMALSAQLRLLMMSVLKKKLSARQKCLWRMTNSK